MYISVYIFIHLSIYIYVYTHIAGEIEGSGLRVGGWTGTFILVRRVPSCSSFFWSAASRTYWIVPKIQSVPKSILLPSTFPKTPKDF